jgi:DNA primase large subunit
MRELSILAKYPFLNDTKLYIKEKGPSIDELLKDVVYERARTIGIERLDNSLKEGNVGNRSLATESDCIMEILSYPIARMVSVCVGDSYFRRRYAFGEAYHAYKNLLNESTQFLLEVSKELNINAKKDQNRIKVFFKDYVRSAPTRYKEWKLVNRILHNGFVEVSHKELARIVQELLRRRIDSELEDRECNRTAYEIFSSDIQRFKNIVRMHRKKIKATPISKLSNEKLPPCMKDLLSMIQAGENVPHMGRFSLVAFLSSLKLSVDEILKIFSNAPDYQEDKTRYQVEHITGTSSSTRYKSPACDKMKTYGLCALDKVDDICKKINHPVSYYIKRCR